MESSLAMPDTTIHAVGKVLENLNPILYRVALPNGKPVLAHLSKLLTEAKAVFSIDERVVMELTTYDFDQARILTLFPDAEAAENHSEQVLGIDFAGDFSQSI